MLANRLFLLFYAIFIRLYIGGIRIASIWNAKAGEWINGRKQVFEELEDKISPSDRIIWVHCASAGELEQGKPLIEALKDHYPSHKILVSFFSPSGFGVARKYAHADIITYLPADTAKNAKRFVALVKPELAVFVKYEFWYHHLAALAFRHTPLLLVSGIFRKEQAFFKWYGRFYRQLLFLFRHLFVQDETSCQLLKEHSIDHVSVAGDTRFDRVKKIAGNFSGLEIIKQFAGNDQLIVAGSTWPGDEKILAEYAKGYPGKLVVAPHEINASHLDEIQQMFPGSIRYSQLLAGMAGTFTVLVIDNIGMLSRLYHYATVTYIGGGFNKSGIHNTLEAAVYGKPVVFGPNYQKFKEARELLQNGGAFSIATADELKIKMDHLLHDPEQAERSGAASKNYVAQNTGATQKIIQFIQENRLLTR